MDIMIFSLNCWLLPFPFSIHNKRRLKKIISQIRQIRPEIIALQEVWLNKYVKRIENELKDYVFIKSGTGLYNKSGLMTGLMMNHKTYEINHFPISKEHNWQEKIAKKGYHMIELPNRIFFINTHLYAAKNKESSSITMKQFESLQKVISKKRCILAGDLNLDEKDLKAIDRIHHFTANDFIISRYNPYTRYMFRNPYYSDAKIDYIIKTKNNNVTLKTKCIYTPILSDHYAIVGKIRTKNAL